jgi:hypothetical protein
MANDSNVHARAHTHTHTLTHYLGCASELCVTWLHDFDYYLPPTSCAVLQPQVSSPWEIYLFSNRYTRTFESLCIYNTPHLLVFKPTYIFLTHLCQRVNREMCTNTNRSQTELQTRILFLPHINLRPFLFHRQVHIIPTKEADSFCVKLECPLNLLSSNSFHQTSKWDTLIRPTLFMSYLVWARC